MKITFTNFARQSFGLLVAGLCVAGITEMNAAAQDRDPFRKPIVAAPRPKNPAGTAPKPKPEVKKPAAPGVVVAPPIAARIESYKAMRQRAAEMGIAAPKPTTVLTLDEMNVTGIFRTPRGYAAMVEASPLTPKLSYTIYPGEKFYDGQLVAIEEAKLTFRRVTRMTDGKEVVAVSSKVLRPAGINDMAAISAEQAAPMVAPTATAPAATGQIPASAVPTDAAAQPAPAPTVTVVPANPAPVAKDEIIEPAPEDKSAEKPAAAPVKKGKGKSQKSKKQ